MKAFIERHLRKVFGAEAHDPDPARMSAWERREAESATRGSGRGMESELVDDSERARAAARAASETAHPEMKDTLAEDTAEAEAAARMANEKDGAHLRTELAEETEEAQNEAQHAQGDAPIPRSDFVDDSEAARQAAARANEPKQMSAEEKEAQKEA